MWLLGLFSCIGFYLKSRVFAFSFKDSKHCPVLIFQFCEQLMLKELFGVNYYTIIFQSI